MLAQDADMFVASTEHLMAQYVAKCEMSTIQHLQEDAKNIMYVKSIVIIPNRRALLLLKTVLSICFGYVRGISVSVLYLIST